MAEEIPDEGLLIRRGPREALGAMGHVPTTETPSAFPKDVYDFTSIMNKSADPSSSLLVSRETRLITYPA
jgi:hypothetical protein